MFQADIGPPPVTRYLLLPWIPHNLDPSQTSAFHLPLLKQPSDLHAYGFTNAAESGREIVFFTVDAGF
jgi:hypothetical protein